MWSATTARRASKNVKAQFNKTYKHPTLTTSGKHSTTEDGASSAYGASPTNNRHAECADCHNLHYAKSGYLFPATSSYRIMGVSRIAVANGAAGMVPTYTYLPPSDTTTMPIAEYQLCFKCHSSWTTLPTGAKDKAVEFNTNNESFHPVEGPGTNMTTAMANSLAGGTGLPHLTTSDTIWCSDCHNSDDLPTTVTTLSNYSGFVPKGPHGSNVGFTDSNMSPKILRANYRVKLMPQSSSDNYNATNFTLCYICHKAAPFEDNSGNSRTDTNFRFHGFHLRKISNNPADGTAGDLETPGNGMAGQGNAICKECHYTIHSTKLTYYSTNRSNSRLVSFSPSISGPGGTGSPSWSQTGKSCSLKCHGKAHTPKTY